MNQKNDIKCRPIGIFDSGVGGLTVLNAFLTLYPPALYGGSYVYIGDTARLPYGTKSPQTIIKYSETITRALLQFKPQSIVIACNTASTHALPSVKAIAQSIPVFGMIEPAVKTAIASTKNNHIAVIGTVGTILSNIYETEIKLNAPHIKVSSVACQMLVALAEEDWVDTTIAQDIIRAYLGNLFNSDHPPDVLILGCTHFPLFKSTLQKVIGDKVILINTGLEAANLIKPEFDSTIPFSIEAFVTDNPNRFKESIGRFISLDIEYEIKVTGLDI